MKSRRTPFNDFNDFNDFNGFNDLNDCILHLASWLLNSQSAIIELRSIRSPLQFVVLHIEEIPFARARAVKRP